MDGDYRQDAGFLLSATVSACRTEMAVDFHPAEAL